MDPDLLAAMIRYGKPEPEPEVDEVDVEDFFAAVEELADADEGVEPLEPGDILPAVERLELALGRELFADEYSKVWVDAQHQYSTSGEVDVEAAFVQAAKMRGKDPFDERGQLRDPEAYDPGDRQARRARAAERIADAMGPAEVPEPVSAEDFDMADPKQHREYRRARMAEGLRDGGYES